MLGDWTIKKAAWRNGLIVGNGLSMIPLWNHPQDYSAKKSAVIYVNIFVLCSNTTMNYSQCCT